MPALNRRRVAGNLQSPAPDDAKIAAFARQAEAGNLQSPAPQNLTTAERIEKRSQGMKGNLAALRGTSSQRDLLNYAAKARHMSKEALLRKLVFDVLEEEYGCEVPIT